MKRTALILVVLLVAACGTTGGESTTTVGDTTTTAAPTTTVPATTTAPEAAFPVTVEADNGPVTIDEVPEAIVSLSSTATEVLFALGAGEQVVAVDDQSNYPEEAPKTDLSAFTPNVEAILAHEPDLVVIAYDPGELIASLQAADVSVINQSAALTVDGVYDQIEALGAATGHSYEATILNESIQTDLKKIVADAPEVEAGTTYYHELDNTFFSVTSTTFFGQIYSMFGLENIADEADPDGAAGGFPQLSSEFVVAANPDLIFLANALYGESAETVAARPGWEVLTAVEEGNVVALDSDVASRWGPRIVDFARSVSDALEVLAAGG